jgi:hypothetical protein
MLKIVTFNEDRSSAEEQLRALEGERGVCLMWRSKVASTFEYKGILPLNPKVFTLWRKMYF